MRSEFTRLGRRAMRLLRHDPSDPRIDAIFARMDRLRTRRRHR